MWSQVWDLEVLELLWLNTVTKAMAMVLYTKGIGAGWMAQRVVHGVTRYELKHDR